MRSAAATVTPNDVNRPMRPAASAGMMSRVNPVGVRSVSGATRIPPMAARSVASTQQTPAWKSGEYPSNVAPRSFSAAARVANPKRVYRRSAQHATPAAMPRTGEDQAIDREEDAGELEGRAGREHWGNAEGLRPEPVGHD